MPIPLPHTIPLTHVQKNAWLQYWRWLKSSRECPLLLIQIFRSPISSREPSLLTCGFIFLNKRDPITSTVKVHSFGMRLISHMQFGDHRVPGLFLWSIIHLRLWSTMVASTLRFPLQLLRMHGMNHLGVEPRSDKASQGYGECWYTWWWSYSKK